MSTPNLLITGGSGFIGKNLSEYLRSGFNVFTPSHSELDLLDADNVESFIQKNKIKTIIHAANVGGGRDTEGMKNVVETNLRMFLNVIRNEKQVDKIIHFGSGAEYDKTFNLKNVRESEFGKNVPKDDYGFYKYVCSEFVLKSDKTVCLRLFGVYGKYENYLFKFISNSIVRNLLHLPVVIGQNVIFDYLFIEDLNVIVKYFLENKYKYKDYNAASGTGSDLLEIAEYINSISDYNSDISVINKGLNLEYTADISRLRHEFPNIRFTNLEVGIKKLFRWYNTNLDRIDRKEIIKDPYFKNIKVHKNTEI